MKEICKLEVNLSDLEALTGEGYRPLKKKLESLNPCRVTPNCDYYYLKDALLMLKQNSGTLSDEERKSKIRLNIAQAIYQEIRNEKEMGTLIQVEEAQRSWAELMQAFTSRLESIPQRVSGLFNENQSEVKDLAEEVIEEAILELNRNAVC